MGRDKALLQVDGQSMIRRAAQLLGETCSELQLACGPEPRYSELGLPLVLDAQADGGPLAGICAGLKALQTSHGMVLACDMPRMQAVIVRRLFEAAEAEQLDVCYLATERGVEPLCAIYSQRCLPAIERALSLGVRKVTAFVQVEGLGTHLRVGQIALEQHASDFTPVCNVNTPEDLARVQGQNGGPQ